MLIKLQDSKGNETWVESSAIEGMVRSGDGTTTIYTTGRNPFGPFDERPEELIRLFSQGTNDHGRQNTQQSRPQDQSTRHTGARQNPST